eukprot:CAMPEP_0201485668 /NCGR_PEP_ID=MMETSP0151_2-20130828/9758_1 /ASSEMBLY_ACC=CAM_ASM_000257 /TAXON_ID=200890 /ORGANISM="Paramoeba atlantica, Strain 621/1 / CCAP 1560/9" /LENGTH=563 /DNA_ID=CAMNT_0047869905 /DNA_START=211 /DNA_END=1902 /DNA_ORIENTATION=+
MFNQGYQSYHDYPPSQSPPPSSSPSPSLPPSPSPNASPSHPSSSSPSPSSVPLVFDDSMEARKLPDLDGTSSFKKFYRLSKSPFDTVTAEGTDSRIRRKCLIPNLQVSPVDSEQKTTSMLFFGPRGSGKTTIRMEILRQVDREKFLVIECYKHSQFNQCLNNFRDNTLPWTSNPSSVTLERPPPGMHWVDHFKQYWTRRHFVACLVACAMKKLVNYLMAPENQENVKKLTGPQRIRLMFLAHRYALCSPQRILECTESLLGGLGKSTLGEVVKYGGLAVAGTCAVSATSYAVQNLIEDKSVRNSVSVIGGALMVGVGLASYLSASNAKVRAEKKAGECLSVVASHSPDRIQAMSIFLENYLGGTETAEEVLKVFENPLKDLKKCVKALGFLPLLVCDGLDEADLLDPCKYPGVMNHLVREMCYHQILNNAFLLLFLPDSVSNLGLNDPFLISRWRRDIFPPRELQWETDLLLHLAARRFAAYQIDSPSFEDVSQQQQQFLPSFDTMMSKVTPAGRARHLSRLQTPRQMLLCCETLILRLEREGRLYAADSDLELAVQRAIYAV